MNSALIDFMILADRALSAPGVQFAMIAFLLFLAFALLVSAVIERQA